MTSRSHDEEEFRTKIQELRPNERSVIEDLIEWSRQDDRQDNLRPTFSTPKSKPNFSLYIKRPGIENLCQILTVYTSGIMHIVIKRMMGGPPFSDSHKREDLIRRIAKDIFESKKIVFEDEFGSKITAEGQFPTIKPASLNTKEKRNGFYKTLDWIIEEINKADAGTPGVEPSTAPDGPAAREIAKMTTEVTDSGYFSPSELKDEREKKFREIVVRRGQPEFRNKLIKAYGGRCAVTGCDARPVLEAAHIHPYTGPESHHVTNGLLLRADIHTLFDLELIGINPESQTISVATAIKATEYARLEGQKLTPPIDGTTPNHDALTQRWERFGG